MFYKFVSVPIFVEINPGVFEDLDRVLHSNNLHFNNPLLLTGEKSFRAVKKYSIVEEHDLLILPSNINNDILLALRRKVIDDKHDVILACGGGRVIDIGKYIASQTLIPIISAPTLLASDAISSPISVLRVNGEYRKIGTVMPIAVIVDLSIIRDSPTEFILAGLGELMSNISASYDWILAHKEVGEKIDYLAYSLAYMPAVSMLYSFERYSGPKDLNFLRELAYGLILSGVAMNIAHSSRPASGSEHNISHALDRILGERRKHHGLQVGFATILTTYLQGQIKFYDKLLELYGYMGFPRTLKNIGIGEEAFLKALLLARGIRNRYTILNKYNATKLMESINILK